MKTARMIVGIISLVFCVFITFQSCAAGLGNAIADNGETSGTAGIGIALFWLVAGIIAVAARKSKGGAITAGVFYLLAGIIGNTSAGTFTDLKVYAVISFVFAAFFIIGAFLQKKAVPETKSTTEAQ